MSASALNSMLLSSTDPDRLRDWYVQALQPDVDHKESGYRMLRFGTFWMMIDTREDVSGQNPEPGRVILNFDVTDARETTGRIDELGGRWVAELEDRDGSLFATAVDPDGNYVQIIQLSEQHRAAMAE
ncbi:VOC family protein [Parasphingorhabdus pacifica]